MEILNVSLNINSPIYNFRDYARSKGLMLNECWRLFGDRMFDGYLRVADHFSGHQVLNRRYLKLNNEAIERKVKQYERSSLRFLQSKYNTDENVIEMSISELLDPSELSNFESTPPNKIPFRPELDIWVYKENRDASPYEESEKKCDRSDKIYNKKILEFILKTLIFKDEGWELFEGDTIPTKEFSGYINSFDFSSFKFFKKNKFRISDSTLERRLKEFREDPEMKLFIELVKSRS